MKLNSVLVKVIYDAYVWGWEDKEIGLHKKSYADVKESLERGFKRGIMKAKSLN